ncbi:MAG: hypothetical protein V4625_01655 [Pseudomonadota bacterium]
MNTHPVPASGSDYFHAPHRAERLDETASVPPAKLGTRLAPYIAFFVMVFASMAAAATVVSEAPMMLVGLY